MQRGPPRREAHAVDEHAAPDRGEGIAREVEIGHRVDDDVVGRGDQILQRAGRGAAHLLEGDALHRFLDEGLAAVVLQQIVAEPVPPFAGLDVALGQPLIEEGPHKLGMRGEHLAHQILQIDDLDAVFPQDRREGVVLALRVLQIGDVVEEQLAEPFGRQLEQLAARAVQQHLFQRADLTLDTDPFHSLLLSVELGYKGKGAARAAPFSFSAHMLSGADTPMSASALRSVIIVALTRPRRWLVSSGSSGRLTLTAL